MTETAATHEESNARAETVAPDVGLPGRLDMRRAFDIYVFGRSRTLAPAEKGGAVGGAAAVPFAEPSAQVRAAVAPGRGPGVPVPEELNYERNAGTWRMERVSSKEGEPSA